MARAIWSAMREEYWRATYARKVGDASATALQVLEIRAHDGVVGIELQRPLPGFRGVVALLTPQPDVADLEVHVAAKIRLRLHRALEGRERVVEPAHAIEQVADVLVQLRQRRVVGQPALGRGQRVLVGAATL